MDILKSSEYRLSHVDHIVPLNMIIHVGLDDLNSTSGVSSVDAQTALRSALRESAALRQGLHDRHAALQTRYTGPLHFAVDVEDRRTVDVEDVAARHHGVKLGLARLKNGGKVDVQLHGTAIALTHQSHHVRRTRNHTAGGCDHLGHLAVGLLDRVAPRLAHLTEHRNLRAADLNNLDVDLRIQHELPVTQCLGNALFRSRNRQAAHTHRAHQ